MSDVCVWMERSEGPLYDSYWHPECLSDVEVDYRVPYGDACGGMPYAYCPFCANTLELHTMQDQWDEREGELMNIGAQRAKDRRCA